MDYFHFQLQYENPKKMNGEAVTSFACDRTSPMIFKIFFPVVWSCNPSYDQLTQLQGPQEKLFIRFGPQRLHYHRTRQFVRRLTYNTSLYICAAYSCY